MTTATPNLDHGQANRKKKIDPMVFLRIVWSMLRRRYIALCVGILVALVVGALGSRSMNEQVWKVTGLLLYTPPTIPEDIGGLNETVQLTNMSGFATSRPVLNDVRDKCGLDFPIALLNKGIKVETARNSQSVFVSLEWGDKEEGVKILNQLFDSYPAHVAKVRSQIAKSLQEELERQVAGTESRLDAARVRYRDFTRDNNLVDFKQDLVLLQTKILDLETREAKIKRDEQSMRDQIVMLDGHIKSIKQEQEDEQKANAEFEAANESLADNRRRQNRLRELIQDERRVVEVTAQIQAKRREYERQKVLNEKQLIPNSQLEKVRAELETLISKIAESQEIRKWKQELTDLDKLVVPKNKVSKKGSPIIQQILFKKLETQLNIAHGQKGLLEIERDLANARKKITSFLRLRNELQTMEDEIEALNQERLMLESKTSMYRELAEMGPTEFSIVSEVSAGNFPASSTRKKNFMMLTAAMVFLTFSTVAAFDVLRRGIIPTDAMIELLGVSRFEKINLNSQERNSLEEEQDKDDAIDDPESVVDEEADEEEYELAKHHYQYSKDVRRLALRVRREIPDAGSVLMLTNVEQPASLTALILQLSECMANRDERILVIDARPFLDGLGPLADSICHTARTSHLCSATISNESNNDDDPYLPGIRDWLSFKCNNVDDVIFPTSISGVDCILPGRSDDDECLMTLRMTEGIQSIKSRYTLILMLTHDASYSTENHGLATYADKIAIAYDPEQRIRSSIAPTIRGLIDLDAPLIGSIEI